MKYWHKLTDKEVADAESKTFRELRELYLQPSWCAYPDAIDALGCWSLIGKRWKISKKFCKDCERFATNE